MKKLFAAALMTTALASVAAAQDLRIGYADEISSLDPELNNHAGNHNAAQMLFAVLSPEGDTGDSKIYHLAESWELIDDTTMEFKIRDNAFWSDGEPVIADDFVFSYERARDVPGSVATFGGFLRTVEKAEAKDDKTLVVTTVAPDPLLLNNLSSVFVVSKHAAEGATSDQFDTGEAMVNQGPYLMESYTPGDRLILKRNEDFWGEKPEWVNVDYIYINNPAARTAALLAGDVDVIDKVSLSDIEKLENTKGIKVHSYPGLRVLMLQPNQIEGSNQFITDNDGKPLDENPLLDKRVRQALTMAINRDAIAERIMRGGATAASQWMPEGAFGYNPDVKPIEQDPERAKELLAEAGYPDGFRMTMHIPSDRYPNSTETAQAVAQYWSRIGVDTEVEVMPFSVYSGKAKNNEFAMSIIGWGNGTGEASYAMTNVLVTPDPEKGLGASNWGHYSNPDFDAIHKEASSELDADKREALFFEATEIMMEDVGVIPLFHYRNIWASRDDLFVEPWSSDRTVAMQISSVKDGDEAGDEAASD